MLFIMDGYLQKLYECMINNIERKEITFTSSIKPCSDYLHKIARKLKDQNDIIFNYNEEGKLHSRYLGDRYEPAIILQYHNCSVYYYLFDGEIKDCIHPVSVQIIDTTKWINYYSSERIKQELPVGIHINGYNVIEFYNIDDLKPLLEGYKSEWVERITADYPEQDYTLHNCMELMSFKFAD